MNSSLVNKAWTLGNLALGVIVFALSLLGFIRDLPAFFPNPQAVDLVGPYAAAVILNSGQPQALYDYSVQQEVAKRAGLFLGGGAYNYLPFLAVLLRPLVSLSFRDLAFLWLAVSLLALFITSILLLKVAHLPPRVLSVMGAFGACLLFAPFSSNLAFGQVNTILFFLVISAVYLIDSYPSRPARNLMGGLFIGFATAVKIYPVLLLVPIAIRRQWHAVIGTVTGFGLALLIGFIGGGGISNTWRYMTEVLPAIGSPSLPTNQSLDAAVQRLFATSEYRFPVFSSDNYVNVQGIALIDAPFLILPIVLVLSLLVVVGVGWTLARIHARNLPAAWDLSLILTAVLIISPLVWDYYHGLLLIPWATWWRAEGKRQPGLTVILLAVFLITIQRYWKPIAALHFPVWLLSLGLLAVIVTFVYTIYLASAARTRPV